MYHNVPVIRIVNNIGVLPLSQREHRPEIAKIIAAEIHQFNPDILHIQHTQFMTPNIQATCPIVWTLHDAWGWCPAGGTLFRNQSICDGPSSACNQCYADWQQQPTDMGMFLIRVAGRLSSWISPTTMHHAWKKLPGRIRSAFAVSKNQNPTESIESVNQRNEAFKRLAYRSAVIISPSNYLADNAAAQGYPKPKVIPILKLR